MDVFDTEFADLEALFSSDVRDFGELGARHGSFIDAIEKGLFLDQNGGHVMDKLVKAFEMCDKFCGGGDVTREWEENVEEVWSGFGGGGGKRLERFLTRVDFNRWYSIGKREV